MMSDLISIVQSKNPILILKDLLPQEENTYRYKVEIFVGGESGTELDIGSPTLTTGGETPRLLFPNEARLRNLTYAATVTANLLVRITYTKFVGRDKIVTRLDPPADAFLKIPLVRIPIMLHSKFCVLHDKPPAFLKEAGECIEDYGGYFIVDGSEKVLITKQEQAFNTLYVTPKDSDPKDPQATIYTTISCLSPKTRQVKTVSIRLRKDGTILVGLPFVRAPVPLFIVFRALGIQSDQEIVQLLFPDLDSAEAKLFMPLLQASILEAYPFTTTWDSIQYIKLLTKGFSEFHVIDILRNQTFVHMSNEPRAQALFLADCVKHILRVDQGFEAATDRDDIRNQRCLVSGFLLQMLFSTAYVNWTKAFKLGFEREYELSKANYKEEDFKNLFDPVFAIPVFRQNNKLTDSIMSGFKGKWDTGLGEDKEGVLQAMSRLSYTDFISHCRRVVLEFDTGDKNPKPRRLHTSQFGYFCTSETPGGASIGISKNMSILTAFSTASQVEPVRAWLFKKGGVYTPDTILDTQRALYVPVWLDGGLVGYTPRPNLLAETLKSLKRSGHLPYSTSVTFSIRGRQVNLYMDAGRPLRPLLWVRGGAVDLQKAVAFKTWSELVLGPSAEDQPPKALSSTQFRDPGPTWTLDQYVEKLKASEGSVEYVDPYEQNEAYIANFPSQVVPETTHVELHPSTILSMMTSLIPFCHHNQSPRNQLGDSQSKQAISLYATNWPNRFDNSAHVLCYGEAPLCRTLYTNYLGEGRMPYGQNIVLAVALWTGYNQDDGIVFNKDAFDRGLFRTMGYRSYEMTEEDDPMTKSRVRIGNPASPALALWKDLRPGLDYTKLDERGIIKEGEFCDETTVLVGGYALDEAGRIKDHSLTPQVWTRGRVEKIVVLSKGPLRMVKVRVVQDRIPELGDKFCLTHDHEVYTDRGWVGLTAVDKTHRIGQLNHATGGLEYVAPLEVLAFENKDPLIEIRTADGGSQCVTMDHRLYVRLGGETQWHLMPATKVVDMMSLCHVFCRTIDGDTRIVGHRFHLSYEGDGNVYCLRVPSEVFLVRRTGTEIGQWTGNSNRHGQKGTAGVFLRGHDMPRSSSGLVPDMIMNTHAIPSRMTIAQNLEQLMGKAMAALGSVADCTAFMNDGSPEAAIGSLLEHEGYEKYGNEILYNGATGEQIPAAIFLGPVYGMRLKHMVEDKWQARAKGRKEMISHQPTGGRGNQGGLKIGEMDRDAIICHGLSEFLNEAFMKRSDGTTMPLCTSCGTVPIYNPNLSISLCPMCDGPPEYAGDTERNLELLPPLQKQTGSIVKVAIPYATNVVTNELIGMMNIGMRYMTTKDVQTLRPVAPTAETATQVTKLRPRTYKEMYVPVERPPTAPDTVVTLEALAKVSEDLANQVKADEALNRVLASQADDDEILEVGGPVVTLAPVFDAATMAVYPPMVPVEVDPVVQRQIEELRRRGYRPNAAEVSNSGSSYSSSGSSSGSSSSGSSGSSSSSSGSSSSGSSSSSSSGSSSSSNNSFGSLPELAPVVQLQQPQQSFVVQSRIVPGLQFVTEAERDRFNAGLGGEGPPVQRGGAPLWGGGPPLLSVDTSPMAMAPLQGGMMGSPRLRMARFPQQSMQPMQQMQQMQQEPQQQVSYSAPILVRKLE